MAKIQKKVTQEQTEVKKTERLSKGQMIQELTNRYVFQGPDMVIKLMDDYIEVRNSQDNILQYINYPFNLEYTASHNTENKLIRSLEDILGLQWNDEKSSFDSNN